MGYPTYERYSLTDEAMLTALKSVTKVKTSESMHLRLPMALYQTIKDIAIAEGRTVANTIRRLLTEAIERRGQ